LHALQHNAARRHCIPRLRYRVRNWQAYEADLQRRGDLTLWVDEAALTGWRAPRRSTPGGQPRYADVAIEAALMFWLVFHLALRQAAGLAASVLRLLGPDLPLPAGSPVCAWALARFTSCWKAPGWSCSAKVNGTRPSTAAGSGNDVSCTWPWMPAGARSARSR
jgi:hypothetical protein